MRKINGIKQSANIVVNEPGTKENNKEDNGASSFMSHMPWVVNRIYADFKAFADKLQNYKNLKSLFQKKMKYELNLASPLSYNEKIIWKKLFDRNPLLTVTADKYKVRSYIRQVLGEDKANEILVPLYYVTEKPESIPFNDLPEKFVVKPNHGSQMHRIVRNRNHINNDDIVRECKLWLKTHYGLYGYEWAYRNIKRMILVEKLLETNSGELPNDYKFYCFHGKCKIVRVTKNRFGSDIISGYYDTDWKLLQAAIPGNVSNKFFEKPAKLHEMINLAEKLAEPFDYVRVDLYNLGGRIFFGELTHYEASGLARLEPESFDFMLGKYWNIKSEYWIDKNKNTKIEN